MFDLNELSVAIQNQKDRLNAAIQENARLRLQNAELRARLDNIEKFAKGTEERDV